MLQRSRPSSWLILVLLLCLPAVVVSASGSSEPEWTTEQNNDIRTARFSVSDADCAYRVLADPQLMEDQFPNVIGHTLHSDTGSFQDLTLEERFIKLAKGTSRYHRTLDGHSEIRWTLIEGRQKRHDGVWTVTRADSGGRVEFRNEIEAKSKIHQGLFRVIQKATMKDIVTATRSYCGSG